MTNGRRVELGRLLEDRRRQMHRDVQGRKRNERAGRPNKVGDIGDTSEAGSQEDFNIGLLQRNADALGRIDEALGRIDAGTYGDCLECHAEIPEQRLRALPFAVRCTTCEVRHERDQERGRRSAR